VKIDLAVCALDFSFRFLLQIEYREELKQEE
jgi:hypothetical protein